MVIIYSSFHYCPCGFQCLGGSVRTITNNIALPQNPNEERVGWGENIFLVWSFGSEREWRHDTKTKELKRAREASYVYVLKTSFCLWEREIHAWLFSTRARKGHTWKYWSSKEDKASLLWFRAKISHIADQLICMMIAIYSPNTAKKKKKEDIIICFF